MNITNDEIFYVKYDEDSKKIEYKTKRKFENRLIEYLRENKVVVICTLLCAAISFFQIYLTIQFFSIVGTII